VAAGAPSVLPGLAQAWPSFSGTWRPVAVEPDGAPVRRRAEDVRALAGGTGPEHVRRQVIARLQEEQSRGEDSTVTVSYVAIDDGQRGRTFGGHGFCSRVALGDLIGHLLTAADAATLIGPVEVTFPMGTPRGSGIMNRGTPVWGIGDEAWSMHRGRSLIVRVADEVVKMDAVGPAPAADAHLLRTLSATLAVRLAAPVPGRSRVAPRLQRRVGSDALTGC
jgi:hypothetical protein